MSNDNQQQRPDNETGRDENNSAAYFAGVDPAAVGMDRAFIARMNPDGSIGEAIPWPGTDKRVIFGQPNESDFSLELGATSIDFNVTEVQLSGSQAEDGDNFLSRMFEPEPLNARLIYRPGDTVKLKRRDLFGLIPVGAVGVVQHLEHPETSMSAKGRPFFIRFDLTPFNQPWPDSTVKFYEANRRDGDPDMPAFMVEAATNFGVNDLELISKGDNWRPDYKHEYETDGLADAIDNMTPAEFQQHLEGIFERLAPAKIRKVRTPGTPPTIE